MDYRKCIGEVAGLSKKTMRHNGYCIEVAYDFGSGELAYEEHVGDGRASWSGSYEPVFLVDEPLTPCELDSFVRSGVRAKLNARLWSA